MINAVGNRMTREIARQQKLAEQLERTQIQISGGKKLLRMSDDPVAARRIATIGTKQASMTAWSSNVNAASALVSQADGVMQSDRKSTRLNSSHSCAYRMPSSALTK